MVSILAVLLILFILAVAYFGLRYIMNQGNIPLEDIDKEKCSLCRKQFPKNELLVREVYDVKVYFFCKDCIESLNYEVHNK
jgi:hypothetical protein